MTLTCEVCEQPFERRNKRGLVPVYCGARCCGRAHRLRRGIKARVDLTDPSPQRQVHTTASFKVAARERQRRYRGYTGLVTRPIKWHATSGPAELLPIGPFRDWMTPMVEQLGSQAVGYQLGLDESLVRRAVSGDKTYISIDTVDRALLHTDTNLWELYP